MGCWLVVYLPLWKVWFRQLRWWNSQLNGNIIPKTKHIPDHQPNIPRYHHEKPHGWHPPGLFQALSPFNQELLALSMLKHWKRFDLAFVHHKKVQIKHGRASHQKLYTFFGCAGYGIMNVKRNESDLQLSFAWLNVFKTQWSGSIYIYIYI